MTTFNFKSLPRNAAILTLCAGLAACDAPATGGSAATVDFEAPAERLFVEFCLNKENTQASEVALRNSGRFGAPEVAETDTSRVARYPLLGRDGDYVTVASGAEDGLLCEVRVDNRGPSLYLDGSIRRSG